MTTLVRTVMLPVLTRLSMLPLTVVISLLPLLTLLAWLSLRTPFPLRLTATWVARRLARMSFSRGLRAAILGARASHRARAAHTASLVFVVCRTIFRGYTVCGSGLRLNRISVRSRGR